jgi:hypothetical protein
VAPEVLDLQSDPDTYLKVQSSCAIVRTSHGMRRVNRGARVFP